MSTASLPDDELLEMLAAIERQASGTLRAVAQLREEIARRQAANEERAPASKPVPLTPLDDKRLEGLLASAGYVPSGAPVPKAKKRGK